MKASFIILEDNLIASLALETMLVKEGWQPLGKFKSADDLLTEFNAKRPDLILMDVWLEGDKSGLEAAAEIREVSDVPILFITALSDKETLDSIGGIGCSAIAPKPFSPQMVLDKVNTLMSCVS